MPISGPGCALHPPHMTAVIDLAAFFCLTYFQKNNICFGGTQHLDIISPLKILKHSQNLEECSHHSVRAGNPSLQRPAASSLPPGRQEDDQSWSSTDLQGDASPSPAVGRGPHKVQGPAPSGDGKAKAKRGAHSITHSSHSIHPTGKSQACGLPASPPKAQNALLLPWAPWVLLFLQRALKGDQ